MQVASLYTSMAGLQAISARMEATAANLANLQTPGYAAVQAVTEAAPYAGADAPGGADAVAVAPGPDTGESPLSHTGDPMTVGLSGNAWLQVQTASGNALTRNGSLQISNAGILTDSSGDPILSTGGQPISLPSLAKLEIGADGTVSGIPASTPGGAPQSFGQIALIATPAGSLTDLGNSLFAAPAGAALTPAAGAKLEQGYLNGSNVDATQSMMELIADSRSYQLQTDLMKTQTGGGADLNTLLAQG